MLQWHWGAGCHHADICMILCVVIRVTAGSGSYLRATCFPHVQLACAHHSAGQVASPSPVITVSTSLHVTPRMPYTSTYTYKCKCVCLLTRTWVDSIDSLDWFGAVPLRDIREISVMVTSDTGNDFLNWAADEEKVNFWYSYIWIFPNRELLTQSLLFTCFASLQTTGH